MSFEISPAPPHSDAVRALVHCALDELTIRYGDHGDAESVTWDELAPPRGVFLVARHVGELAGGVAVRTISDPTQGIGEIKRLWVRPDLRGRGLARQLMRAAEEWAKTHHFVELYLETGERQPEAIALYHALDYEAVTAFPDGVPNYPEGFKFHKSL